MTNPSKSITTVLFLLAGSFISGCSDTPAPGPQASNQNAPPASGAASSLPKLSQMTLTVGFIFGDTKKFSDPDAALIEKQARGVDWQNAQQRPLVHLARVNARGSTALKIQGTLGTPNEDGAFRTILTGVDANQIYWEAETPPLESVDAAIELLLLLRNDVEKLRSLAEQWKAEGGQ